MALNTYNIQLVDSQNSKGKEDLRSEEYLNLDLNYNQFDKDSPSMY